MIKEYPEPVEGYIKQHSEYFGRHFGRHFDRHFDRLSAPLSVRLVEGYMNRTLSTSASSV